MERKQYKTKQKGASKSAPRVFESDDDYATSSLSQKSGWERSQIKKSFYSRVNQYSSSKSSFDNVYRRWLPRRSNTLMELRLLYQEVHEKALKYNESQATFKELSYNSRCVKQDVENETIDFLASLTLFFGEAASGINSIAQAFNVDTAQTKFQNIIDEDAEITKDMYALRSQCFEKYRGIEEVMRNFQSCTFASTVNRISNALERDKQFAVMSNAYEKDDMPKLLNAVGNFFENAHESNAIRTIGHSVQRYVDNNPAALEACTSTGRAVFGAINNFGKKEPENRRSIMGNAIKSTANLYLMMEDKKEIERLRNVIKEETCQSKLEYQIQDAIETLESEMEEMIDMHRQLFKSHTYSDDSD